MQDDSSPTQAGKTTERLSRSCSEDDRAVIAAYIADFSQEFRDIFPLAPAISRAVNLYLRATGSLDDFIAAMYRARAITQEHVSGIRGRNQPNAAGFVTARKMPYFFSCLAKEIGA